MMEKPGWETDYRIPSDTDPIHYNLYLHPDMKGTTFAGRVSIEIAVKTPRDYLLTHVKFLTVDLTRLYDEEGNEVSLESAFEYEPNEFWVVKTSEALKVGKYSLHLEFKGKLDNGIVGFYRSSYLDDNGVKKTMVSSKFQPTYARRAFPCFDEPSFKSTFSITLVKPSDDSFIAVSNMPETGQVADCPSEGLTEVRFEKSVPMVTYLAVFMISEYGYLEKKTKDFPTRFRVYGSSFQLKNLKYALDLGAHVAGYYESCFDTKFPLPKLDMAAIPEYSSGATEHWGLITYRETALIYDEKTNSVDNRERVADVISHELAHQWFGNLVTVAWWNDLWLNEGFASYVQYKGVKSYETSWDTDARFLTDNLHPVLDLDATIASHPIVVHVESPDEITSVFDTISYNKGSSVIRMMEDFMGTSDFMKGISNFLKRYAYETVVTQDLFNELSAVSLEGLNVTEIMNTWTMQKGYPVLTVSKTSDGYILNQQRFLLNPITAVNDTSSPFEYKWEIPVTFFDAEGNKDKIWFHAKDSSVEIKSKSKWIKLNVEQRGYYRVNYPLKDWMSFTNLLIKDPSALSSSDKTGLLNDAFSLAKSTGDFLTIDVPLTLTRYLTKEKDLAPWITATDEFKYLNVVFHWTSDIRAGLHRYERQIIKNIYNNFNWTKDAESHDLKKLRKRIFLFACASEQEDCLLNARNLFKKWKDLGEEPHPNLKPIVCIHGLPDDEESWNWLFDLYKSEKDAQKKTVYMMALGSSKNPKILKNFLELAKDDTVVRTQDYFSVLSYISRNWVGESIVWDFLRKEWDYLVGRFTLNDRVFARFIAFATSKFSSEERLTEMKDFFKKHPKAGAGANFRKIALEAVENNIQFIQKHSQAVRSWLETNVP